MKNVFISVNVKNEPNYEAVQKLIKKIPEKKLALCYSNQFIEIAKKIYEKNKDKFIYKTQVLGCSNPQFPQEVEGILIIGQGKFHSVSIAYESKLPTYILEGEKINKINNEDIEKLERKERGAYLGYLNAKTIGILISSKPGQERLSKALKFQKSLKNKKSYLFVGNDLNISEFENFGIDFWINTACPRMDLNNAPLINLDKLEKLIRESKFLK
jgi:2-(3-amino-3-carboxypropyl)histidine synthase